MQSHVGEDAKSCWRNRTGKEKGMKENKNVLFSKFAPEKTRAKFGVLFEKVLARQELIARGGHLAASWKTYRGKRLGPYYRVEFRETRTRRKIYIGRDQRLAELAGALLEELKRPYLFSACPKITCGAGVSPAQAAGTAAPQKRGVVLRQVLSGMK